jgi:hypothetical protein
MDEEPLPNRLAELEAANAICRRDIEALMSSCDKLEARNTELEAALTWYSVAADWELKADGGDRARAALSNFP